MVGIQARELAILIGQTAQLRYAQDRPVGKLALPVVVRWLSCAALPSNPENLRAHLDFLRDTLHLHFPNSDRLIRRPCMGELSTSRWSRIARASQCGDSVDCAGHVGYGRQTRNRRLVPPMRARRRNQSLNIFSASSSSTTDISWTCIFSGRVSTT